MPAMRPVTDTDTRGLQGSRVVVVEDDRSVREMLAAVLAHHGHGVVQHDSAEEMLAGGGADGADLVILDLGLPGVGGLSLCRRLRHDGFEGPILMLTAQREVTDRVAGLDAGADDYLAKPFALDELLARVRALLRRAGRGQPDASNAGPLLLSLDDLEVDTDARRVVRAGRVLELTRIEYDLLLLLVENADRVLTRDRLTDEVWGYEQVGASNSLEVHVSSLRRKLEADGGARLIHTVRGIGYVARLQR